MDEIPLHIKRELKFRRDGQVVNGRLIISGLKRIGEADKECWACLWSLSYLSPENAKTYGDDPLDALLNFVRFLESLIRMHNARGDTIWWKQEDDKAGLEYMVPL